MGETLVIYDQGEKQEVVVDIYDPFPDEEPRENYKPYNEKIEGDSSPSKDVHTKMSVT